VLDSVVVKEKLYVAAPVQHREAFESLTLADEFRPGQYVLEVGPDGRAVTLSTSDGVVVQRGELGEAIGRMPAWNGSPQWGRFRPDAEVEFTIMHPREAGRQLSERLGTRIDQQGNFLSLSLGGRSPEKIASTLNSLMERHVQVAAELKSGRLRRWWRFSRSSSSTPRTSSRRRSRTSRSTGSRPSRFRPTSRRRSRRGSSRRAIPVFTNYFDMQVELEDPPRPASGWPRWWRRSTPRGPHRGPRGDSLGGDVVGDVRVLDELVQARSELRALRERYSDDFPPVQDPGSVSRRWRTRAIPGSRGGFSSRCRSVRTRSQGLVVTSAGAELSEIPPRTIEEGRRRRRVQITETLYNELRSRVETARLAAASSIPDVRVLDRATVPQFPSDDQRIRFAGLIFLACIGTAIGGALLMDRFDAASATPATCSKEFGLDILGSIPRIQTGRGRARKGALKRGPGARGLPGAQHPRRLRVRLGRAHHRGGHEPVGR
jgi:hypothetical protein